MKVLVVDDSPTSRAFIRKELEAGGYEVLEATSGQDALALLKSAPQESPPQESAAVESTPKDSSLPQLVTLDVEMPVLDGYEVCQQIRKQSPVANGTQQNSQALPIVFITANDTLEGRIRGFNAGATDFIRKPFGKGELLKVVDGLLKPEQQYAGESALVVDDSATVRNIIANTLRQMGLRVTEAEDGRQALEIVRERMDDLDLVITDFTMPVMDGPAFCRHLRNDLGLKDLPVIFLSAAAESSHILEMFNAGADDYLVKPFAKEVLIARVNAQMRTRRLTRRLNQQVEELKRLNQLKNDFIAITSQDLRTPLTAILGYTDLLASNACDAEETQDFLGQIRNSATGLLSMVGDIITLSRLQSVDSILKLKPIPIYEELHQILLPFKESLTRGGIELKLENKFPDSPLIMGNEDGLLEIFDNLMTNAIKHTSPGGKVEIEIHPEGSDAAVIWFKDSGEGMSPEHLSRIFDWVDGKTHEAYHEKPWRGLGLLITKDLVEKQHATIEAFSKEGKGMQFKIVYPLALGDPPA